MGIAWASVSSSTRSMNSRMSALPSYWIFHPCKVVIIAPQDSAGVSLGEPDAMVVVPLSMFQFQVTGGSDPRSMLVGTVKNTTCFSCSWGSCFR